MHVMQESHAPYDMACAARTDQPGTEPATTRAERPDVMIDPARPRPQARMVLLTALTTLGLTAAHHAYGGLVYATAWRTHGATVALALGLPLLGLWYAYQRSPGTWLGRLSGWALAGLVLVLPVLMVGLFEGTYNHLLK